MSKKATAPTPSIPPGTRKKRGDSPEKLSPATSAEPNDAKRIDVIWDEALESLRIKEAEWDHPDSAEPLPEERRSYSRATVAVKKKKLLPVNQDSLKDRVSNEVQGALSGRKKVVVVKVAPETNKIEELAEKTPEKKGREQVVTMQPFSMDKRQFIPYNESVSSSIVHHEKRMLERQNLQEHLMNRLDRKPHELAMNVETREKEFKRDMIDRLLPYAEKDGHGFWKGAEFWNQNEWIGGEERGIFITPGQAQRGFPAPIERANVADAIRTELGLPPVPPSVPSLIDERFRQLKKGYGLGGDLEPHTPDLRDLIILPHRDAPPQAVPDVPQIEDVNAAYMKPSSARSVPERGAEILSRLPNVLPSAPLPGPALRVCDHLLKPVSGQVAGDGETAMETAETRLVFECMAGGTPCKNTVELSNIGTTVVFYSWRRLPVENTFQPYSTQPVLSLLASNPSENFEDISKIPPLPPVPPQRFYFDATDGVLLPGAKINLPVVFKSALAGVFSERWLLTPTPPAMPPIIVNFRGVAAQPDIHAPARAQLTAELSQREATAVCRALVRSLVDGIRTPPRPSSPIGAPGRRLKGLAFRQQNTELNFDWQRAGEMERLWNSACQVRAGPPPSAPDGTTEAPVHLPPCEEWDLSVDTLYKTVTEPPPEETPIDEEAMEQLLAQLNDNVAQLGFSEIVSQYDQKAAGGRILMSVVADSVADQALSLRQALGLPPPPDIPQQPRPTSSVQGTSTAATGRAPGPAPSSTAAGKAAAATPAAHRGSATKGARGQAVPAHTPGDAVSSPPTSSGTELGVIKSPSDLINIDPSQAIIVAKYVDKLQTTSRSRIKELINSLIDNVADLVDKQQHGTITNFSVRK